MRYLHDILDIFYVQFRALLAEQRGDFNVERLGRQLVLLVLGAVDIVEFECESRELISSRQKRFETILICADNVALLIELVTQTVPIDNAEILEHLVHLGHLHFVARLDSSFKLQQHRLGDGDLGLIGADVNGQRPSLEILVDLELRLAGAAVRPLLATGANEKQAATEQHV